MLTPMNYRRGFQRLYFLCSALWVAVVLTVSIRDRPRTIDYDALAEKHASAAINDRRTLTDAEVTELDKQSKSKTPFVPPPLSSY